MYNEMIHILLLLTSKIADTHTHTHTNTGRDPQGVSPEEKNGPPHSLSGSVDFLEKGRAEQLQ